MFLIGICGPLGCGKSTLARMICKSFKSSKIIPFAFPLKKAAVDLGWDGKKDEKGRRLLQLLGTEIGRECIYQDIWVDKWAVVRSEADNQGYDIVVADDMRFLNELDQIKTCGGICIRLEGRDQYTNDEQREHISETGLDCVEDYDFAFTFDNAGPIDDMQNFAQTVVGYLHMSAGEEHGDR